MSTFPGSPFLIKGGLVSYYSTNPSPQVIAFQYNPETLTRTLEPQINTQGSHSEAFRLKGPPIETISLDVQLDATDQLEKPEQNQIFVKKGIHPQLSALEILLYPSSEQINQENQNEASGKMEVQAAEGPLTLFVWGANRVAPIRLTGYSIVEQDFDTNLNPIRAKISLKLRVLSSSDLSSTQKGYSSYLSYQKAKETMAQDGTTGDFRMLGNPRITS